MASQSGEGHLLKVFLADVSFENRDKEEMRQCSTLNLTLITQQLPDDIWSEVPNLRKLWLCGCSIKALPPVERNQLECLREVHLEKCRNLEVLPDGFWNLKNLEEMEVEGCSRLLLEPQTENSSVVVNSPWEASSLKKLVLSGCSSLPALPAIEGHVRAPLQHLELSGCSSLKSLPEKIEELRGLQELDLSECSSLQRLPETLGQLRMLKVLKLSGCISLKALPFDMSEMRALRELHVARCYELQGLPQSLEFRRAAAGGATPFDDGLVTMRPPSRGGPPFLDLSYCHNVHSMYASLLDLSDMLVACKAEVRIRGWAPLRGLDADWFGTFDMTPAAAKQLRLGFVALRLLADQELVLTLLERLSWLGVLLGAATFSAALNPSNNLSTNKAAFFVLDMLSFGFSMMLVVFVVACTIPQTGQRSPAAAAGLIWLSLLLASALLILAVMCGMLALVFGVWDLNDSTARWGTVFVPGTVSLVATALLCGLLLSRLWAVFPGPKLIGAAAQSVLGSERRCRLPVQQPVPAATTAGQQQCVSV